MRAGTGPLGQTCRTISSPHPRRSRGKVSCQAANRRCRHSCQATCSCGCTVSRFPHQPVKQDLPGFGARLKRLRRARNLKQAYVAAIAGVCQTTVSRWEAGVIEPPRKVAAKVLHELQGTSHADTALRRLVESSRLPVHLISDADHRLLAASDARWRQWGPGAHRCAGESLWPFATDEIVAAEEALSSSGWWDQHLPDPVEVVTRAGGSPPCRIAPGRMLWERVWLSDGTPARICTSV